MSAKPNIVIFMTDHQRGDTIRKNSACVTPNIDRFRKTAVTFTNAFCPSPHCCPSRATFFTGLYPSQHGVWNNVEAPNSLSTGLFDGVRTFSEDLKDAGYRLYFSGKWHVSATQSPQDCGFEMLYENHGPYMPAANAPRPGKWERYAAGNLDRRDMPRGEADIIRPGYPHYRLYGVREEMTNDEKVTAAAVKALEELKGEQPFVLFVGPIGPHDPYLVPQRFLDLYPEGSYNLPDNFDDDMQDKPVLYRRVKSRYDQLTRREHLEGVRHYLAYCSYEDYLFGRVMDALEASGRKENTLVLYCSDHGDYLGEHGLWAKGLPCLRGAYNICTMAGGAGVADPGRECDLPISLADWAPTFREIAGAAQQPAIGRSLTPILRGLRPQDWREDCFSQSNGNEVYGIQRSVWNRKWKYVYNTFDFDELYDLENDPQELHNLVYGPHPEKGPYANVVYAMFQKLWKFAYDSQDNIVNPYIVTAMAPFGPGILTDGEHSNQ